MKNRAETEADEIAFFADYYEHQHYNARGWRYRLQRELASLRRALAGRRAETVLSVGCGDGQFELMLAPYVGRIVAIDISPQAIEVAKRQAERAGVRNIEFLCLPLHELQWRAGFDAVVCLAFLHHLNDADLQAFLRGAFEHLRDGGIFYSQDPNRRGVLRAVGRVLLGAKYHVFHSPDERELDPKQLARSLTNTGFRDVSVGYIDFSLIPALFLLARRSGRVLRFCVWLDWLWCRSPMAPWASGFKVSARKPLKDAKATSHKSG